MFFHNIGLPEQSYCKWQRRYTAQADEDILRWQMQYYCSEKDNRVQWPTHAGAMAVACWCVGQRNGMHWATHCTAIFWLNRTFFMW